jgi:hypothetical protein
MYTASGGTPPRSVAIRLWLPLVVMTRSAARNVLRSRNRRPASTRPLPSGNLARYISGERSWWSNTKRLPNSRQKYASGQ